MAQMRAVVAERPDGPDGLVVREVPRPEPRPGWALVRVEAFGLNRSEYKTLKGYAGDAVTFPRILGIELVGAVEAVHGDAPAVPPGTFVTAAGSLEHLGLRPGETLMVRGATSSVGLACLELARAADVRVIAT